MSKEQKDPSHLPKAFSCDFCSKAYTRQNSLQNHCLEKHDWSLEKKAPASPKTLAEFREKRENAKKSAAKKKEKESAAVRGSTISEASSYIISSSELSDVEPVDESKNKNPAEKELEQKPRTKEDIVGWSPEPRAVSETAAENPCARKRMEPTKPACPVKKYLTEKKPALLPPSEPGSSKEISSMIVDCATPSKSETDR